MGFCHFFGRSSANLLSFRPLEVVVARFVPGEFLDVFLENAPEVELLEGMVQPAGCDAVVSFVR